ncbi:MAG: DOMON-like domain-containing protein, partial [Synechococcaceae cyanobacterium]
AAAGGTGSAGGGLVLVADLERYAAAPGQSAPATLTVRARAWRRGAELQLAYAVSGPLEQLRIPPPHPQPQRRDGLWQHTCLEAFLAVAGQTGYWEVNLAPAGHWNLYRLDGYRRNLRPEPSLTGLALAVEHNADAFHLHARLPLPPDLAEAVELDLALAAVLEHGDGDLSYWALAHPPGEPDFHWRGGWRRCR